MTIDAVIDAVLKDKVSEVVDAVEKGQNSGIFGMCEAGGIRIGELATEVLAGRDYQVLSVKMEVPRPGKDTAITLFDGLARQIQAEVLESRSFSEAVENLKRVLVRRAKQRKERLVISIRSFDNCRHMPDDRLGNFFYGLWEVYKLGKSGGVPVIILESTRCLTMLKSKCANIYESSDLFRDFRNVTWASPLPPEKVQTILQKVEAGRGENSFEEAWRMTNGHVGLLKLYLEKDRSLEESTAQLAESVERMLREFYVSKDETMTWFDCLQMRAKGVIVKDSVSRCLERYGLLDSTGQIFPLLRNNLVCEAVSVRQDGVAGERGADGAVEGGKVSDDRGGADISRGIIRSRSDFIEDAKSNFKQGKKPMLLYGETGSGKSAIVAELVDALVEEGLMAQDSYISISPDEFDAEHPVSTLLGHDASAWTGCVAEKEPGLFEQAHKGILFIDEAEDIPTQLQQAMLCPLQSRIVHRVAASGQGTRVDPDPEFMPIFASNVNPEELVKCGKWRKDFKARVSGWLEYEIKPELENYEQVASCVDEFLRVNYKRPRICADELAKRCVFEFIVRYAKNEGWRQVEQLLTNLAVDVQKECTEENGCIALTGKFVLEDLARRNKPIDERGIAKAIEEQDEFEKMVEQKLNQRTDNSMPLERVEFVDFCALIKVVEGNPQANRDEVANVWGARLGVSTSKTGPRNRMQRLIAQMGFNKNFRKFRKWVLEEFSRGIARC